MFTDRLSDGEHATATICLFLAFVSCCCMTRHLFSQAAFFIIPSLFACGGESQTSRSSATWQELTANMHVLHRASAATVVEILVYRCRFQHLRMLALLRSSGSGLRAVLRGMCVSTQEAFLRFDSRRFGFDETRVEQQITALRRMLKSNELLTASLIGRDIRCTKCGVSFP